MQELARLMSELTLALKARSEAGKRTEALAREVQGLPKLSVIAPEILARAEPHEKVEKTAQTKATETKATETKTANTSIDVNTNHNGDRNDFSEEFGEDLSENLSDHIGHTDEDTLKLRLQLELQDLRHAKQEGFEALQMAASTVSKIREAVNAMAAGSGDPPESIEDYETRIQAEKSTFAEYQQRKQDVIFSLSQKLAKLVELERQSNKLHVASPWPTKDQEKDVVAPK